MTVTQSGSSFTGSMASQMGTVEISGGTIAGQHLTWSIALPIGGQTMILNYSGDVDGTRISGTVSVGDFGTFPFTGEKRP